MCSTWDHGFSNVTFCNHTLNYDVIPLVHQSSRTARLTSRLLVIIHHQHVDALHLRPPLAVVHASIDVKYRVITSLVDVGVLLRVKHLTTAI